MFALPGLHRVDRGAEVAFIEIARELQGAGHDVTLIGSGPPRPGEPYRYIRAAARPRERFEAFPSFPPVRSETAWEDLTFLPGLWSAFRPRDFDIAATCSFPFTHWALRAKAAAARSTVRHVFITQNGDWPARSDESEFRFFRCDGLVCTNPDYFALNKDRYRAILIPNGVDLSRFAPGPGQRAQLGLPEGSPIVLMVSALIASKNVAQGIAAVAEIPGAVLVVAGDGPLREKLATMAAKRLLDRFIQRTFASEQMPDVYRSADAFLHLSTTESFGNVYVEAMATGLPVIAYDQPRTRWIVGPDAFYADPGNPDGLVDAVRAGLAAGPGARDAMRRRASEFGWPAIARQYAGFLASLIPEQPPSE